jgi:hypothetical protein
MSIEFFRAKILLALLGQNRLLLLAILSKTQGELSELYAGKLEL